MFVPYLHCGGTHSCIPTLLVTPARVILMRSSDDNKDLKLDALSVERNQSTSQWPVFSHSSLPSPSLSLSPFKPCSLSSVPTGSRHKAIDC